MALRIQNMSVGYRSRRVISGINLPEISSGSLVAVIGPNAVGKSTFLKSLAGINKYSGEALLNNVALSELPHSALIRALGYLPQTLPQATTLVAYELVFSACRAVRTDLSQAEIEHSIDTVFQRLGIEHLALRRLAEMSGGQRQMVGLAQVLVRQPTLLLLDEPTSALDLHWQLNVLETIRQEVTHTGAIGLVASHDLNLALRFCDLLLILNRDGVLAFGAPQDVLTPENLHLAYGIEGRVEQCSKGYPIVLADRAIPA
ncbi:ABC transporter ATP-binding protein [Alkalimarinus coralli]|uniref:ABC transporter ATP-binding protein n=1 Tax=Alkalimarinus coralli TaxID=2935863 RepID=UPI00202ADECD|nr:ABC transporter ATP-binding protein [Alkalimarinus coralli]